MSSNSVLKFVGKPAMRTVKFSLTLKNNTGWLCFHQVEGNVSNFRSCSSGIMKNYQSCSCHCNLLVCFLPTPNGLKKENHFKSSWSLQVGDTKSALYRLIRKKKVQRLTAAGLCCQLSVNIGLIRTTAESRSKTMEHLDLQQTLQSTVTAHNI